MAAAPSLRLAPEDFELEPMRVHSLPCKIHYTGPAPVDQYFTPQPLHSRQNEEERIPDQSDVLVSTFRGRRLLGREEKLGPGVFGLICRENGEEEEEGGNRVLVVEGNFDAITYWKQDCVPRRAEESVPVWMDFVRLSRVLHGVGVIEE